MYPEQTLPASIQQGPARRIAFPTSDGLHLVAVDDITYCSADGNYTRVHLSNGTQMMISKTLGALDQILSLSHFIRVHQSYLVHTERIACLQQEQIILTCGTTIPVSRSRRAEVRQTVINNTQSITSNSEIQ